MGIRSRRLLLSFFYNASVLGLGAGSLWLGFNLGFQLLFDAGSILILLHLLAFRRIPMGRYLERLLVRYHRCSSCGVSFGLWDQWKCKCGYVSAIRSALSPCPQCHKGFAAISCPHCNTSVLV